MTTWEERRMRRLEGERKAYHDAFWQLVGYIDGKDDMRLREFSAQMQAQVRKAQFALVEEVPL
jgi:hypothetical protein